MTLGLFGQRAGSFARWGLAAMATVIVCHASATSAQETVQSEIVARDPAGHGLVLKSQDKTVLFLSGTPEQMGAAHGTLLQDDIAKMVQKAVYLVGGVESVQSGEWFLDTMAEIERRAAPHVPARFVEECDAMARAAGVSVRDGRYLNLFPERFHCSGVAVRGKASLGGRVLHARVLDYMRDIGLQDHAVVAVFMPDDHHNWMSLGYAGFVGTVTAMNEQGLAIGEMGGGGEGDWDGMPMSLLLREIMERASTVEEALAIFQETPRTCEYYYVLSDKSGNLAGVKATPDELMILGPGEQHPELPLVPEETVMFSAYERAEHLSQRLQANYGRIDVPLLIEMIKRPVSMESNLHDAIMAPETLEIWVADAGRYTPACDEPYAHFNLADLIRVYEEEMRK